MLWPCKGEKSSQGPTWSGRGVLFVFPTARLSNDRGALRWIDDGPRDHHSYILRNSIENCQMQMQYESCTIAHHVSKDWPAQWHREAHALQA